MADANIARYPDIAKCSVAELSYAAGFFDGEGHICISYRKANENASSKSKYAKFHLIIQATQTSNEVIHWLADRFGGRARYQYCKRSYDDKMYSRWAWECSTARAGAFLKAVRPYLVVKAEQADIAIAFQDSMRRIGSVRVSTDVWAFRWECHRQIRQVRKDVITNAKQERETA